MTPRFSIFGAIEIEDHTGWTIVVFSEWISDYFGDFYSNGFNLTNGGIMKFLGAGWV